MKKIGKLSINPEKVIKNEELVNLKGGGYGELYNGVTCADYGGSSVSFCIAPGTDPEQVCSGWDMVITWQAYECD